MQLELAKSAGFCFGVERAVKMAHTLAERGEPLVTLGAIIHNPAVVDQLASMGVSAVDSVEDIPCDQVIVRSHGVGRDVLARIKARGIHVWDATCPFVKRIHVMTDKSSAANIPVVVVGDGKHPEVIGILGWARGLGQSVLTDEEIDALPAMERALVVSQTTLSEAKFAAVCDRLRAKIRDMDVHKTICPATATRQAEAVEIAKRSQAMFVVGGRNSANTRKLYELCRAVCPDTYFIESASDLDDIAFDPRVRIGMTAGASTPDCTFKEVVTRMNDIERQDKVELAEENVAPVAEEPVVQAADETPVQEHSESTAQDDFMADVEKTLVQLKPGQTVTGTVLQINDEEVCVNVGYKADGLVKKADLSSPDVKIGDEIEVEVVKVNDGEGNVLLSQRNIVNRKAWDAIVAKYEAGEYVDGVGKEAVKGGLIATVNGVRTFIPASQLSNRYIEKISDFVGKDIKLKIIEIDPAKKRIVASHKAVLAAEEAQRKKAIWDTLEVGAIYDGIVRRITDFGAFVDIGGVDGLVHVTDLCWHRVRHPSDVVSIKQPIQVKILSIDPEKERIALSYKQTQPRPWDVAGEKYPIGSIVSGKVVRITTFGAFVELEPGLDGLVHISQCALTRIAKVEDAVNVGDVIRVKVLDVNPETRRISLSIRAVLEDEAFEGLNEEPAVPDEFAIDSVEEVVVAETPEGDAVVEAVADTTPVE